MQKRGQITFFIIFGILILIFAGVFFLFQESYKPEIKESFLDSSLISSFVNSCLKDTTNEGIIILSIQGGYLLPPEPYYEFLNYKIPFYFDQKILTQPNREIVGSELENYVDQEIVNCLADFSLFKEEIIPGKPESEVIISLDVVKVKLNLPLIVKKDNLEKKINEFNIDVPVELGLTLGLVGKILEKQQEKPNYLRMSYLTELGDENNMVVNLIHTDKDEVFYNLEFLNSKFNDGKYDFGFAMKYKWQE